MVRKSFELATIPFTYDRDTRFWYPVVRAGFLTASGVWRDLPMLFDPGSTDIVIRPIYAPLFAPGTEDEINAVGQDLPHKALVTTSRIELFGVEGDCEIVLDRIPANACFAGLLGRKCCMPFGFGFWESARELYVTLKP